jgi:glutathione S-transferase
MLTAVSLLSRTLPAASLRITTTQTRRLSTRNAMETLEDSVLYHIPKTSSAPVVQLVHELNLQDDLKIETLSFDHVRTDVKYGALNPKRSVPALKLRGGASYTGSLITESGAIISLLLEVSGECAAWSAVQRTKMWESVFYTGTTVFPVVVKAYLKTIEEQDSTFVEEAQKTFVETVAPLLIRQHSLDPTGPWLLSASGVEGPTAADFVLAKPLGNARAMGWLADFPALEAWLDRVKKLPSYEKAYS